MDSWKKIKEIHHKKLQIDKRQAKEGARDRARRANGKAWPFVRFIER